MVNSSNNRNQRKNSQNKHNRRNDAKNRQNRNNSTNIINDTAITQNSYKNNNSKPNKENATPSDNTRITTKEGENTSKNASANAGKNISANTRANVKNTAKKSGNVEISTVSENSAAKNAPVEHSSHHNRRSRKHVDFNNIVDETPNNSITDDSNAVRDHSYRNNHNRRRKNTEPQTRGQNQNEEKSAKTGWSEDEMSVILDSTTMGAIKRNNALFFWEIDGLLKSNGTQHSWVYLKNNPPKLTFKRPKEQPFTIFLGKEEVNQLAPALEAVRKAYNAVPIQEKKKEKWTLHNFANIFKSKFYENPGLMVAKIAAIIVMVGIAIFALCL